MASLLRYQLEDSIATITLDDGKVNALSFELFAAIAQAIDRAETEARSLVLTGRDGAFSAGFHLPTLRGGGTAALRLLRSGFELSMRLLALPCPVVVACNGHAMAMGAFVVASGDYRIGADAAYHIAANEVAIGLTLPQAAVALLRHRLNPAHLARAAALAERFDPAAALAAGFLDRVVAPAALAGEARLAAQAAAQLDARAFAATKARIHGPAVAAMREALDREFPAGSSLS